MKKLNIGQFTKAGILFLAGILVTVCGCAKEPETGSLFRLVSDETAGGTDSGAPGFTDTEYVLFTQESEMAGTGTVFVHVCGEVNSPGVYEVARDSRIYDAVLFAGGFTTEASEDYLNLAMPVSDGMQIRILSEKEASEERERQVFRETGLVNINTASVAELCTLPGIGESRAQDIITYRTNNGIFETAEEIMQVSGIKESMYDKIKDKICVK